MYLDNARGGPQHKKYKFQSFHTEIDLSDYAHEYFISMDQVKKIFGFF